MRRDLDGPGPKQLTLTSMIGDRILVPAFVAVIDNVLAIKSADIDPADKDLVLNIIGVTFEPGEDCAGRLVVTFSGDGALALELEALDVKLKDVSRPYQARAKSAPAHDLD